MTIFIFITAMNYFCKKSRNNPFCFDSGHTNKYPEMIDNDYSGVL